MRAAVVTESHEMEIVDVADPSPGPAELLLQVTACGICGSDLKARPNMPVGIVMGHEFCGTVVAVGADAAADWRVGQQVAALPVIGCGTCAACLAGEPAHCATTDLIGVGGSSGGYAEFVRVSARESFALPEHIDDGLGALVEPLAVGLHAVERAQLRSADAVLVVGAGELVVSDPSPERRAAAAALGATRTLDPTEETIDARFDVVFECVGLPGMTDICMHAAKLHGRVIIAGVCTKPDPYLPFVAIMKELSVGYVVYYTRREFGYVVDAIGRGAIDPSPFVTQRIPLDGVNDAFRELIESKDQCKVLVLP
jgi:(R,R)-butanediol dehydrogenase / meso-butanediol dehydrogenase / diacetyl reductase